MEEIKLNAKIISENDNIDINVIGNKNKNKIIYKENEINVTITINKNKISISRCCNDYKINLKFENKKNTLSTYNLFGAPKMFYLNTYTKKLIITDKLIKIDYILEDNTFSYILNIGG